MFLALCVLISKQNLKDILGQELMIWLTSSVLAVHNLHLVLHVVSLLTSYLSFVDEVFCRDFLVDVAPQKN